MLVLRGTKKLRHRIKGIAARPDDASTLVARVPEAIATALRNQGVSEAFIAAELAGGGRGPRRQHERPQHRITSEFAMHLNPAVVARLS